MKKLSIVAILVMLWVAPALANTATPTPTPTPTATPTPGQELDVRSLCVGTACPGQGQPGQISANAPSASATIGWTFYNTLNSDSVGYSQMGGSNDTGSFDGLQVDGSGYFPPPNLDPGGLEVISNTGTLTYKTTQQFEWYVYNVPTFGGWMSIWQMGGNGGLHHEVGGGFVADEGEGTIDENGGYFFNGEIFTGAPNTPTETGCSGACIFTPQLDKGNQQQLIVPNNTAWKLANPTISGGGATQGIAGVNWQLYIKCNNAGGCQAPSLDTQYTTDGTLATNAPTVNAKRTICDVTNTAAGVLSIRTCSADF